jgi:type IX secretion system PorP/SprF family membrane protein
MKKVLLIIFCVVVKSSFSQQLAQYSQYLRNQFMINPGAAGVYDFTDVTIGGRIQWVGFTNSPKTTYLSFTSPLAKSKPKEKYNPGLHLSSMPVKNPEIKTGKFKQAIGSQMIADEYGAFRKIQFSGTYAIHIPITKIYNLSFGTKLGITNHTFLKDRAYVADASGDNTYTSFTANQANKSTLDIGAGLYFYSDKLFFGIAGDQLTGDMVHFGSGTANFDPKMHYTLTGGYKLLVRNEFTITPAFLLKYMSPVTPTVEASMQFEYKEWIWAAASYRHKDALIGMIGLNINHRIKFGYSYDFSISKFNTYSSGGHELILGIMLR